MKSLEEAAEFHFQDKLSKFAPYRKPVDGFVSNGFERNMFDAGFNKAIELLYLRYEDKENPPKHPASAREWGNWLKTFAAYKTT